MRLLGDYWENIALNHVKNYKLKKVYKNYNSKFGEIDIIMTEGNTLVFVEVKYRKNRDFVSPEESVTRSKQVKIIKTSQYFLLQNKKYQKMNCRFDVVSVTGDKKDPEINWIKNAFY